MEQNNQDTIVYRFGDSLYVNLTNRCSNNCTFCLRNYGDGIGDNRLWLKREPSAEDVIEALNALQVSHAPLVVFCGYGEPTYRLDTLLEVGRYVRALGVRVRLDTNGQGALINGREIAAELSEAIDAVSISLNASTGDGYQAICKSVYGVDAYDALQSFAAACKTHGIAVQLSIVDNVGADEIAACRRIAATLGVELRVREYIEDPKKESRTRETVQSPTDAKENG